MNSRTIYNLRYFGLILIGIALISCGTMPYQKISD
jgi:hypothetical protein